MYAGKGIGWLCYFLSKTANLVPQKQNQFSDIFLPVLPLLSYFFTIE
jgi:hypothetical protein